jgi:uncharacterized membrane protein YedE/YeeE
MVDAIIGGSLIGVAAVWLFLSLGRVAGISGIAANALLRFKENLWPVMFVVGLGIGGWLAYAITGGRPEVMLSGEHSLWLLAGGLLVGFGTRMGSGCTSGHGVCGMARLSKRSFAATLTFLAVGMLTATLVALL